MKKKITTPVTTNNSAVLESSTSGELLLFSSGSKSPFISESMTTIDTAYDSPINTYFAGGNPSLVFKKNPRNKSSSNLSEYSLDFVTPTSLESTPSSSLSAKGMTTLKKGTDSRQAQPIAAQEISNYMTSLVTTKSLKSLKSAPITPRVMASKTVNSPIVAAAVASASTTPLQRSQGCEKVISCRTVGQTTTVSAVSAAAAARFVQSNDIFDSENESDESDEHCIWDNTDMRECGLDLDTFTHKDGSNFSFYQLYRLRSSLQYRGGFSAPEIMNEVSVISTHYRKPIGRKQIEEEDSQLCAAYPALKQLNHPSAAAGASGSASQAKMFVKSMQEIISSPPEEIKVTPMKGKLEQEFRKVTTKKTLTVLPMTPTVTMTLASSPKKVQSQFIAQKDSLNSRIFTESRKKFESISSTQSNSARGIIKPNQLLLHNQKSGIKHDLIRIDLKALTEMDQPATTSSRATPSNTPSTFKNLNQNNQGYLSARKAASPSWDRLELQRNVSPTQIRSSGVYEVTPQSTQLTLQQSIQRVALSSIMKQQSPIGSPSIGTAIEQKRKQIDSFKSFELLKSPSLSQLLNKKVAAGLKVSSPNLRLNRKN